MDYIFEIWVASMNLYYHFNQNQKTSLSRISSLALDIGRDSISHSITSCFQKGTLQYVKKLMIPR